MKARKSIAAVVMLLLVSSLIFVFVGCAKKDPNELKFLAVENGYVVTAVADVKRADAINIPATHNDMPVVGIKEYAFKDCVAVKSLVLPEGLEYIGMYAFLNCYELKEVVVPASVKSIGIGAFFNSGLYRDVALSDNADKTVYAGNWAVDYVLYELEKKDGTIGIKMTADDKNKINAKEVAGAIVIKDGTVGIADYALYDLKAFSSVSIPSGVKYVGEYVFFRGNPNGVINCGDASKPESWHNEWNNKDKKGSYYDAVWSA